MKGNIRRDNVKNLSEMMKDTNPPIKEASQVSNMKPKDSSLMLILDKKED